MFDLNTILTAALTAAVTEATKPLLERIEKLETNCNAYEILFKSHIERFEALETDADVKALETSTLSPDDLVQALHHRGRVLAGAGQVGDGEQGALQALGPAEALDVAAQALDLGLQRGHVRLPRTRRGGRRIAGFQRLWHAGLRLPLPRGRPECISAPRRR